MAIQQLIKRDRSDKRNTAISNDKRITAISNSQSIVKGEINDKRVVKKYITELMKFPV